MYYYSNVNSDYYNNKMYFTNSDFKNLLVFYRDRKVEGKKISYYLKNLKNLEELKDIIIARSSIPINKVFDKKSQTILTSDFTGSILEIYDYILEVLEFKVKDTKEYFWIKLIPIGCPGCSKIFWIKEGEVAPSRCSSCGLKLKESR
mgnify:CR=1 FL=1